MPYGWIIFAVVLVIFFCCGIFVVRQQNMVIIEFLGKFKRVVGPGLHFRIPIIERIAARVNMRTHQVAFNIDAKTKDNVTISMDIAAQYHVSYDAGSATTASGVYRSYYMLANPIDQMRAYLIDALRSAVPGYTLDGVFEMKDNIASDVNATVAEQMRAYGYDLVNTLITSIGLPRDVEQSMNSINSAQREKVAAQSLAEAEKIKIVTEAQASAEAMQKAGEGIAAQRKAIAEGIAASLDTIKDSGVSTQEANQLFMFTQWVDMMSDFAKSGKSSTVVVPSDYKQTMSMMEQLMVADASKK